jgi:hypothetical protein
MLKKITWILLAILLSACGGGGGGGGSGAVTTSPVIVPPEGGFSITLPDTPAPLSNQYKTAEYSIQSGLNQIKAAEAYLYLSDNTLNVGGSGVLVAVSDSGVESTHTDLDNNINSTGHSTNGLADQESEGYHGTHVAGIVAAEKNNSGMHGVAFNSKIVSVRILGSGTSSDWTEDIINSGAKIVNASWGLSTESAFSIAFVKAEMVALVNNSNQFILLVAAGNSSLANPGYPARSAPDAELNGQMIAVASVDSSNNLSSFSNQCGDSMNFCLVAPGNEITSTYIASFYTNKSGTSMAAPHVAGAAAVIKSAWSYLTGAQIAQILLTSATDLGAAGVDAIYGHGLLNLEEAVQAQGANNLSASSLVNSSGYDLQSSSLTTSSLFGDAFSHNIAGVLDQAVFFDRFGRHYKAFLNGRITAQQTSIALDNLLSPAKQKYLNIVTKKNLQLGLRQTHDDDNQRIKSLTTASAEENFQKGKVALNYTHSFTKQSSLAFTSDEQQSNDIFEGNISFLQKQNFTNNPYIQTSKNRLTLQHNFSKNLQSNFSYQNDGFDADSYKLALTNLNYVAFNKLTLGFNFGNLQEGDNQILNSAAIGAFEAGSNSTTNYITPYYSHKLSNSLDLVGSYTIGKTEVSGNDLGIFRNFNNIESRGFSLGLLKSDFLGGNWGFAYSQPLRISKGSVDIDIPISRDDAGNVERLQSRESLVPTGKEQDWEVFYKRNLQHHNAAINFNFLLREQPNNITSALNEYIWAVKFSKKF